MATDEVQLLTDLRQVAPSATADDPYAWIFETLAAPAQALYDGDWPAVHFTVRLFRESRAAQHRYAVRATTEPASERSPITVVLAIDPLEFGPEGFAAIPALLVHECVCHVAARPIGVVDNLSSFSEGFMDWAAEYYRQLWLPGLGALALPAEEHARRVFDSITRAAPGTAPVRGLGHRAARRSAQRLHLEHGFSQQAASAAIANLAVRLNVAPSTLPRKDRLVRELDRQGGPLPILTLEVIRGLRDPIDLL